MIPDARVISEESNETSRNIPVTSSRFWPVDPLDGTKEFAKRTNEFTVNTALIEDGQPVLGVVTSAGPRSDVLQLTRFRTVAESGRQCSHQPSSEAQGNV